MGYCTAVYQILEGHKHWLTRERERESGGDSRGMLMRDMLDLAFRCGHQKGSPLTRSVTAAITPAISTLLKCISSSDAPPHAPARAIMMPRQTPLSSLSKCVPYKDRLYPGPRMFGTGRERAFDKWVSSAPWQNKLCQVTN